MNDTARASTYNTAAEHKSFFRAASPPSPLGTNPGNSPMDPVDLVSYPHNATLSESHSCPIPFDTMLFEGYGNGGGVVIPKPIRPAGKRRTFTVPNNYLPESLLSNIDTPPPFLQLMLSSRFPIQNRTKTREQAAPSRLSKTNTFSIYQSLPFQPPLVNEMITTTNCINTYQFPHVSETSNTPPATTAADNFVTVETPQSISFLLKQEQPKRRRECQYGEKVRFPNMNRGGGLFDSKEPCGPPKQMWSDWNMKG